MLQTKLHKHNKIIIIVVYGMALSERESERDSRINKNQQHKLGCRLRMRILGTGLHWTHIEHSSTDPTLEKGKEVESRCLTRLKSRSQGAGSRSRDNMQAQHPLLVLKRISQAWLPSRSVITLSPTVLPVN